MTSQLPLPGFPATDAKPRTRHRYWPAEATAPYGETTCRRCPTKRRIGPFGAKQGTVKQWKLPGGEWGLTEPPCIVKARKR